MEPNKMRFGLRNRIQSMNFYHNCLMLYPLFHRARVCLCIAVHETLAFL